MFITIRKLLSDQTMISS